MNSRDSFSDTRPRLEVLSVPASDDSEPGHPILFVHGAYTGAWCWAEHYLSFFAEAGHSAWALSLSGHGGSRGRRHLDTFSIDDYVRDVCEVADTLPSPPVLVGHSMGGFVVQKLLEKRTAPGAVLMCAVPPQGLLGSAVNMLMRRPDMLSDLGRLLGGSGASRNTLRDALFAQPVNDDALERYFRQSQTESHRALWDMSLFNLPDVRRVTRTPLLVLGAECDHLIAPDLVEQTAQAYGVEPHFFPGMGHGLMLEQDWRLPAQTIIDWLK